MDKKRNRSRNLIVIGAAACGLIFSACSTPKDVRRMNRAEKKLTRLVNRFPELQTTDTIRDTVQFIVPPVVIDTTITIRDTVTVTKDRWRVRIINDGTNYQIDGGCDTDTVYVPFEVPCETIQPTKTIYVDRPLKWYEELLHTAAKWVIGLFLFWIVISILIRWFHRSENRK
jgi:hypothetical protein